jgi:hypothetical protein
VFWLRVEYRVEAGAGGLIIFVNLHVQELSLLLWGQGDIDASLTFDACNVSLRQ